MSGGSSVFSLHSTGVDPDAYFSVLDEEIEIKYTKNICHILIVMTMIGTNDDVAGRPKTETPTENTIKSRDNGGNNIPSPSDNK